MATRLVYIPETDPDLPQLVHEHEVDFQWIPGRTTTQQKANVAKLHRAAAHRNLAPLLEVSAVTEDAFGIQIGPSNLTVQDERSYLVPVVAAFHGSKVFTGGGPFNDLFRQSEAEILADRRLTQSGPLAGYRFLDLEWGLKSGTMFYDWLSVHAIHRQPKLGSGIDRYLGFTDVGCRSGKKSACHARSCALYVALAAKQIIHKVIKDQDLFINTLVRDSFYQS